MKRAGNIQNHTKAIRGLSISFLIFFTAISVTIAGVYALPPDKNFGGKCDNNTKTLSVSCCWTETDEEGIEIEYCQHCDIDTKTGDITGCGEKFPVLKNDMCSIRGQLACPEGNIPQFDQKSPLTNPSNVKDLEELQQSNTAHRSTVEDQNQEQSLNQQNNKNFGESFSQDNNRDESQNQSSPN